MTTDADALPPGVAVMAAFAQGAGCVTLAGDSNWVATDDGSGMRGAYSWEDNARVGRQMVRWLDLCSSLSLTKSAAPSPVLAGEVLIYTLTAVNRDDSPLTNVVVTDALPAEVSFVDASPPYTGPDAGGVITWSLGALDVDASAGLTMAVRVDGALLTGTLITNQAWVTSDEGPGDTATTITPVSQQIADPLVVKTADPGRARPGQVVTWSIPVLAPADMATMTLRTRVTRDAGPLPPALSNQATLNFDQGTDRVSNRVEVLLPSPAPPTPTPKPRQEKDPTPTPVPPTPIPTPILSPTVEWRRRRCCTCLRRGLDSLVAIPIASRF